MSTKKTINLEKEEWMAIAIALDEAIASRQGLQYPLNQLACGPFIGPHAKVATLLSEEDKPKSSS